jgi:hypothetical protein
LWTGAGGIKFGSVEGCDYDGCNNSDSEFSQWKLQ